TRLQEFSVRALAEPIYMENFGWMRDALAHVEPVTEVVAHVVAAEGKHGHLVSPCYAHVSGDCRGCSRRLRGGNVDAMLPAHRFVYQGSQARATAAKYECRNGHSLRLSPVWRNRR